MKSLLVKQENQGEAFSYEILWKEDFSGLGAEVKKLQLPAKKACIVTDSTVAELYLEQVKQELEEEARQKKIPKPDPEKERWHETHFLLTVFDFYKTRAMGDNINFPIRTYEALEKRGVMPYSEQEKQEAIARFESLEQKRRSNGLRIRDNWTSTDALSRACEFLLKKYFDSIDRLEIN